MIETIRRNLSAAACMDYASPATAQMSEPQSGASCWAVAEISECNSYMSQHLDSLLVPVICVYAIQWGCLCAADAQILAPHGL